MPELVIGCQGQWWAGPMTVLFFNQMELECTQYSIVPSFQSHEPEALRDVELPSL
jgi:hypothetical protein